MELRPYQRAAVESVYRYLREQDGNPVVCIPPAGGKTPILATIASDAVNLWDGRVLVVTHVRELVEQAVDKLRRVCPGLPVGVFSAGLKRRDTEQPVIAASIQSIYRRACELGRFDLIITDECFVAGTQVLTPSGEIPIEQVQPGMFVLNATGMGRVLATSAKPACDLVTLEYSDGTTITCTPNHPIFTESGWRQAGSLEVGSLAFGIESLRVLRERVSSVDQTSAGRESSCSERKGVDAPEVLFNLLFENPQQLHAIPRSTKEGQRYLESTWSLTQTERRKRPVDETSTGDAETIGRRVGAGICCSSVELQEQITTQVSEDRHCEPAEDDCDRAGRSQPSIAGSQIAGLPEDELPGTRRLVRVSHHKRSGKQIVFNLHVSGHPSYFANGLLAHNCHLIPPDGEGMYQSFLADARVINPHVRLIGLTATPFRLDSGLICGPDNLLNDICFEAGIRELIRDGYLCPLVSKAGQQKADLSSLHIRRGEFLASEVDAAMDQDELVRAACSEIVAATQDRNACLIFASGVAHGRHICDVLRDEYNIECGFVCGETPSTERSELLARFRREQHGLFDRPPLKYLCNVGVLTTGFDAPITDAIAILRPTNSPGLLVQIAGRGLRLHPDKHDTLVLDFGGNIERHGPIDQIAAKTVARSRDGEAPAKECPDCHALIATGYSVCPECGHEFPPPKRQKHEATASTTGVLSDQFTDETYDVLDVSYHVHTKRGADEDAPKTMRVDYRLGLTFHVSEWVCVEHAGYAGTKAAAWWRSRSPDPLPETAQRAVEIADGGGLAWTQRITVRSWPGRRWPEVVHAELGDLPEPCAAHADSGLFGDPIDLDDLPF